VVLKALAGALGFLSQLPVGLDARAWSTFRTTPTVVPLAGYVIGALLALPFLVPAPAPTVAFLYVVAVYLVTGINHVDGLADLGDAAAVHGPPSRRREVMKDTDTGVGALVAVALGLLGLGFAGLSVASLPLVPAIGVVVAAEVGAKLGMAAVACFGTASHQGLGSQLTGHATPRSFVRPLLVALPAAALTWPTAAAAVALAAGLGVALAVRFWARLRLDGVNGDVFGAANELARLAGLLAGVIAWTLS